MQRNPLSVQGSNLKNYLKEMNKNFYKQRGVNETEYAKEKPVYVQEMKKLVAKSNPSETNNNNNDTLQYGPDNSEKDFSKSDNPVLKSLKKLDKSALAKLPMIERLVEQGHFGYEHGRNGKGASHERKSDLPATAQTAADRWAHCHLYPYGHGPPSNSLLHLEYKKIVISSFQHFWTG